MKKNVLLVMGFVFATSFAFAAKPIVSDKTNIAESKKEVVKIETKKELRKSNKLLSQRNCFALSCGVKCISTKGDLTNDEALKWYYLLEIFC